MSRVIVIIVPDGAAVPRNQFLENLFTGPYFDTRNLIEPASPFVESNSSISKAEQIDRARILAGLKQAAEIDQALPVILVRNTSISNVSTSTLKTVVQNILTGPSFDVCYLAKWLDKCSLYQDAIPFDPETGVTVAWTQRPRGLQAVMFNPEGRDILLGKRSLRNGLAFTLDDQTFDNNLTSQIETGNLVALTTVPNLIEFDIVSNATRNSDYQKVDECVVPGDNIETTSNPNNYLVLVLIIVLIIIFGWALYKLGPSKVKQKSKYIKPDVSGRLK